MFIVTHSFAVSANSGTPLFPERECYEIINVEQKGQSNERKPLSQASQADRVLLLVQL